MRRTESGQRGDERHSAGVRDRSRERLGVLANRVDDTEAVPRHSTAAPLMKTEPSSA